MLAIATVPKGDYWKQVIPFCNERLMGSLSCTVIVHPSDGSEQPASELRYGSVGINSWGGQSFGFGCASWGAYPG